MSVDYSLKALGEGITLCEIADNKFKSFTVAVKLILPFDNDKAPLYSLALDVIASCSKAYPERDDLSLALTELYSASLNSAVGMIGNNFTATRTLNCLCDDYTIGKERISEAACDILLDNLFEPYLEDGKLSSKYLEQCRADMLDDIDSVINNKRRYAAVKAKKYIYCGEAAAFSQFDQRDTVASCTSEDITKAYYEMLRNAEYLITVVGGRLDESIKEKIAGRILSYDRTPIAVGSYIAPSPLKAEVCRASEEAELNQCKLIMAYKTEDYNELASKLLVTMFGTTPFSKLFVNVREKLSLCYYCDSVLADRRNTLIVNSGLDEKDLALAEKQIGLQLDALAKGDFTDDELENAKLYLADAYLSNYDSKYDIAAWYLYQFICGTQDSPTEKGEKIKALTREDIMNEAQKYKLDTVFVLKPGKGGESDA